MFNTLFDTLAHLKVNAIAAAAAKDFVEGIVPIITSEVASGKTMLIPAICASRLEEGSDPIYVLMPTRFLANNAVDSLRDILGDDGPTLVGCLNGNRTDDDSRVAPTNRLIFTTVGYALASGIVRTEQNIILDEAHELSIDLSLTKAILHLRKKTDSSIRVGIMSATLNWENEIVYWEEVGEARHYTTKGSAFPVAFLERPASSLDGCVSEMIRDHGRKGILVFVEGQHEIAQAKEDIRLTLDSRQITNYEIATVWGGSSGEERRRASKAPPKGVIKILIGTNVLESGISLPWVDSGVSTGEGKVMHVHDGVRRLIKEALPQWRITQQAGRTGRFAPGVFILNSQAPMASRPSMQIPDIKRLPLTELVLHCAQYGIDLEQLVFSPDETPDARKIQEAIHELIRHGFVTHDEYGLHMTDDGEMVSDLPVGFQAAAAYCEASRRGMVREALPLIAAIEVGDIRKDFRHGIGMEDIPHSDSDLIDIAMMVSHLDEKVTAPEYRLHTMRIELFSACNVSYKRYREYKNVLAAIEAAVGVESDHAYWTTLRRGGISTDAVRDLGLILFRAYITSLYALNWLGKAVIRKESRGEVFLSAAISNTSNVQALNHRTVSGMLRLITPRNGNNFMVVEKVTAYSDVVFDRIVEERGLDYVRQINPDYATPEERTVQEKAQAERERQREADHAIWRKEHEARVKEQALMSEKGVCLFADTSGETTNAFALAMAKANRNKK